MEREQFYISNYNGCYWYITTLNNNWQYGTYFMYYSKKDIIKILKDKARKKFNYKHISCDIKVK